MGNKKRINGPEYRIPGNKSDISGHNHSNWKERTASIFVKQKIEVVNMKDTAMSEKMLFDYYQSAKESFIEKMKSEDDERSNLKFKLAAFTIYELSHCAPSWFKNHFLSSIARNGNNTDMIDENVSKAENVFYDAIADYLIKLESEVHYVKTILTSSAKEQEKKEFWQPILFDAFLIVGIYFTPLLKTDADCNNRDTGRMTDRNVSPRYLIPLNSDTDL